MKKCSTGKFRHATHDGACVALRKLKNKQLNVYQCGECKGWHLGNSRNPYRIQQRLDQLFAGARP